MSDEPTTPDEAEEKLGETEEEHEEREAEAAEREEPDEERSHRGGRIADRDAGEEQGDVEEGAEEG